MKSKTRTLVFFAMAGGIALFCCWSLVPWIRTRVATGHAAVDQKSSPSGTSSTKRAVTPLPAPAMPNEQKAQPERAPALPVQTPPGGIAARLRSILEGKGKPRWEALAKSGAMDKQEMISAYQARTNLADRETLTWALAVLGDDEVVSLFMNTLTNEFNGKSITAGETQSGSNEAFVMEVTVLALGLLATRHDSAYGFLQQGIDPTFWQKSIGWTTTEGAEMFGLLTSESIQALGMSGRPDVPEVLARLKTQPLRNTTDSGPGARDFAGDVVQAAFYHDLIQLEGLDGFQRWYFRPPSDEFDADGKFGKWLATDEGREWRKWHAGREARDKE